MRESREISRNSEKTRKLDDRENDRGKKYDRVKEKEKDREKERGKDHERENDRGKEHDRERRKDHDRDKEKDRLKGHDREKERGKEHDRDREKRKDHREKERDRAKDYERENSKEKNREQERGEKDRERGSDKEKKDKERAKKDREREREKERDKEKDREKERDKEKDREKDSEKEREKDREREKEREKERNREKDRDRDRDREKEKDRDRDREKEREKERDREKEKERQKLRSKDREREREKEKEHDRKERDTEREKPRDHDGEKKEKERKKEEKDRNGKELDRPQPSTSELEERIAKARDERLKATSTEKKEAVDASNEDDMAAWVDKSRKLELQRKLDEREKAARMARILAEQDNEDDEDSSDNVENSGYGGKDLAGMKIRHELDKVLEVGAAVLTLKDTPVLAGDDVNEDLDELENIEMTEQKVREDAYQAAKRKPNKYDDKFNNDMDTERKILPQYDNPVEDEGIIIDEMGGISEESRKRLEEARERLEKSASKESLGGSVAIASDYFTVEDMMQFRKPKKKKKLRKKGKLDIDELEADAVAAGLGKGDLGSRESSTRKAHKQLEEQAEADSRRKAYENALGKALDASRVLREENPAEDMEVDEPRLSTVGEEEDNELYKSLEKARQIALKKQKENGIAGVGPQIVAARLATLRQPNGPVNQVPVLPDGEDSKLVFTDTGEFCRSLQLDEAIIRRAGGKDAFGEEDEEASAAVKMEEVPKIEGGWTEVKEVSTSHIHGEQEENESIVGEEPIQEQSVGKGLAGALSLLKERGTLKETVDWGGRNMDKKRSKLIGIVDESNNQIGQRDILLDRVDEFGRTMTPKEAFRKLSHKFHGKGPGKMKQEKRQKQFQEELKLKQMNSGDTPLMSMEKMRDAQAKMHTPYIVISGHIKPGQTSDPRSGFATVEKEPIGSLTPMLGDKVGSLTPMLGDKKVEHFLGIKRKTELGSMGPPPPKKPKAQ